MAWYNGAMYKLVRADNSDIIFPKGERFYWNWSSDGSWYSKQFGHVWHGALVEPQKDGKLLWRGDAMIHEDGPCQPFGEASPSSIIVPFRVDEEGNHYFRGFMQERPVIRDPQTGKLGTKEFSFPGGFALIRETQKSTEERLALEEAGVRIHNPKIVGHATANRMFVPTCIKFLVAKFEANKSGRVDAAQGFQKFLGDKEIRADKLPECRDALVVAAWAFAVKHLGLVGPKKLRT